MKKLAVQKHKYPDADTTRAATVVEAIERAERGGARSGVWIADQLSPEAIASLERVERLHGGPARTLMIGGRHVAIDEV
jgi:DNA-binding sugar fermentation-stimulating protein